MRSFLGAWLVSLRRTRADWPIVATAALIALLAATLLAAGPIWSPKTRSWPSRSAGRSRSATAAPAPRPCAGGPPPMVATITSSPRSTPCSTASAGSSSRGRSSRRSGCTGACVSCSSRTTSRSGPDVMALIRTIVKQEGTTAIVATHDPALIDLADRVIELRDGRVVDGA